MTRKRERSSRTFCERQLEKARDRFRATGTDEEILVWAHEGGLTPEEYRSLVKGAGDTAEFQILCRAVLLKLLPYPEGVQSLRRDLMDLHDLVIGRDYADEEEETHLRDGTEILHWWAACDNLLLNGVSDAEQRWARLDHRGFQAAVATQFADEVIEAGAGVDSGAAAALRALIEPFTRGQHPPPKAFEAVLAHFPDAAEPVSDALVDRFLLQGGHRRALLTLPAVVQYLRKTAGNAAARQSKDIPMSELRTIREDWEPTANTDVAAEVERRALLTAIVKDFLPSLPERMRMDFVAVKLRGLAAADVARATERSKAAVSQNLAAANERLRIFLAARG